MSNTLRYVWEYWLPCFSAFGQPERRADPFHTGRGSFLKGHGFSSQTKHWLIALLLVSACFCVVLFLCLAFPSILPEPVAKRWGGDSERKREEWVTNEVEVEYWKYEGGGCATDAMIRPWRGPWLLSASQAKNSWSRKVHMGPKGKEDWMGQDKPGPQRLLRDKQLGDCLCLCAWAGSAACSCTLSFRL